MILIWRGVKEPYISVNPSACSGAGADVVGSVLVGESLSEGRGRLENMS